MLMEIYEESEKRIDKFEEAAPIKTIGKERHDIGRAYYWSLVIWELIIEQLLNGTPPLWSIIISIFFL